MEALRYRSQNQQMNTNLIEKLSSNSTMQMLPSVIRIVNQRPSQQPQSQLATTTIGVTMQQNENSPAALANGRTSNYYLSNLLTHAQNSGRDSVPEVQQKPSEGMLDDYFQKMQRLTNSTKTQFNHNGQVLNGNRSNSQAVRGAKGRGEQPAYANINSSTIYEKGLQQQRNNSTKMQTKIQSQSNSRKAHMSPNLQGKKDSSHTQAGEPDQQIDQRTPFKQSRLNRNRTTENQNSRGSALNRHSSNDQNYTSPHRPSPVTKLLNNPLMSEQLSETKLRGHYSHPHQQRLQPINLANKISGLKSITSGSYNILEQNKVRTEKESSIVDISSMLKAVKGEQLGENSTQGISDGLMVNTFNKIPLKGENSKKFSSVQRQHTSDGNQSTKDECLVTFFDKKFIEQPNGNPQDNSIRRYEETSTPTNQSIDSNIFVQNKTKKPSKAKNVPKYAQQPLNGHEKYFTQSDEHITKLDSSNTPSNEIRNEKGRSQGQNNKSQDNLPSVAQSRAISLNFEQNQSNQKLNNSLVLQSSSQQQADIKNLHPQGLYLGGSKQRRIQKQTTEDEFLKFQGSQGEEDNLEHIQATLGSNRNGIDHSQSMLVQEYNLSQGALIGSVTDLTANEESERLSQNSIDRENFDFFKKQQERAQKNTKSGEISPAPGPISKMYSLKHTKINYKNNLNMKSFIVNSSNQQKLKQTQAGVNGTKSAQATDYDRASQRSIIESTNAYIRATQQSEHNRVHYLQSAGIVGATYPHGNGLSETDIGGTSNRLDFITSSSMLYRPGLGNVSLAQGVSHQPMQHSSHQQLRHGGMLLPLNQASFVQQQRSEEQRRMLDPDPSLFQLQQQIQRVPHATSVPPYMMKSRQSEMTMPLPNVKLGSRKNSNNLRPSMTKQELKNQYQTIPQQRDESFLSQSGVVLRDQPSFALSSEKLRFELHSQSNIYNAQTDSSFTNLPSNMNTIGGNETDDRHLKQVHSTNGKRLDQNPFQKGPKLHLFKKSRRLKTSSAARELDDEDTEANQSQQTITTGIAQKNYQQLKIAQKHSTATGGMETNTTTINSQSKGNIYGTIDQTQKSSSQALIDITNNGHNSSGNARENSSFHLGLVLNENSAEKMPRNEKARGVIDQSPYLSQIRSEEELRHLNSEAGRVASTIVDVYHDEEDLKLERTQVLAGIESQISKKQSRASRESRGLLHQSRTSDDFISTNHLHHETGTFNADQAEMNGSKHSFQGTKIVAKEKDDRQFLQANLKAKAAGQQSYQKTTPGTSYKKVPFVSNKKSSQQINRYDNEMNQTSIQRHIEPLDAVYGSQLQFFTNSNLNNTFNKTAKFSPPRQIEKKAAKDFVEKGEYQDSLSLTKESGFLRNSNNQSSVDRGNSQKVKNSDHSSIDRKSQERMKRNDSAQTPYFITTPQRTDSNWGGSQAYQNIALNGSNKGTKLLIDAIQNVRSSDSIRKGKKQIAAQTQFQVKSKKSSESSKQNELNIKIEKQDGRKNIQNVLAKQKKLPTPPSLDPTPLYSTTVTDEKEETQKRLYEALQQQSAFEGQRQKLQSQNKAYRQSTRQSNQSRAGDRQQQQHLDNARKVSIIL